MADPNAASRFEKSLGLLTTRFVNLLQEARDGVLDLKVVSTQAPEMVSAREFAGLSWPWSRVPSVFLRCRHRFCFLHDDFGGATAEVDRSMLEKSL